MTDYPRKFESSESNTLESNQVDLFIYRHLKQKSRPHQVDALTLLLLNKMMEHSCVRNFTSGLQSSRVSKAEKHWFQLP